MSSARGAVTHDWIKKAIMIRYRGRATTYGEVWFDEGLPEPCDVDVVFCRQRATPVHGARTTSTLSLVVDLSRTEGELMDAFGKDCRYKVKRAESRDELGFEFINEPASRLEEFRAFYDGFAAEKGLRPCYRDWLAAACAARQLVLTCAKHHGEPLVWHALLVAGGNAWLQYTGSCYRNRDNAYRALVGRANRWLHWQEMLRFRSRGLPRYDWGGLFEDESTPERAGINRFKKEFGGTAVRRYDCVLPITLKGRMWLPLRDAWQHRPALRALGAVLLQRRLSSARAG
jgi:hypothetical protein